MMHRLRFIHDRNMDARFPPDRPSRLTVIHARWQNAHAGSPYPK